MRSLLLFTFLIFSFILISCNQGLKNFTIDMQERYDLEEHELKRVQFFLSEDLVLSRALRKGETAIRNGDIRIREGQRVEEVIIPKGTKGVLVHMPKHNRLGISFEGRGDEAYLMFGPNERLSGKYVLLASDWQRRNGEVTYRGKKYQVEARNADAGLLVDVDKISETEVSRRKVPGRSVGRN